MQYFNLDNCLRISEGKHLFLSFLVVLFLFVLRDGEERCPPDDKYDGYTDLVLSCYVAARPSACMDTN